MTQGCMPGELVGYGQSNRKIIVDSTVEVQLLNLPLPPDLGTRREGMATIHFTAAARNPDADLDVNANTKLVINLKWQAASGGGEVDLDGDNGMVVTVGAATSIVAMAKLESAVRGAAAVVGTTYSVEAMVKWQTGGKPGPGRITMPAETIGLDGFTPAWRRLPKQSRNFTVMCNANAGYATLVGLFSRNGATTSVATLSAPRLEPVPGGSAFYRVQGRSGDVVTPIFELWTG